MTVRHLEIGETVSGLLIDGVQDTPWVGASLTLDSRGAVITVPFVDHIKPGQFTHVQEWFRKQDPPTNMLLQTHTGTVTLFDIRWNGHSTPWGTDQRIAQGTLRPLDVVLAAREGPLEAPLAVGEVASHLDGANFFSRLSAVEEKYETDEHGVAKWRTFRVEPTQQIDWRQGEATMSFKSLYRIDRPNDGYEQATVLHDDIVVSSAFPEARAFNDHLLEQRKIANLLVFLYGRPISFRRHDVKDARFPTRDNKGNVLTLPYKELISTRTMRERAVPAPSKEELGRPLAFLAQLGPDGLERWAQNYENWRRFILPAESVLGRQGAFLEDVVVSTAMALEAAGSIIGRRDGEDDTYGRGGKASTATYAYRCLQLLDLKWTDLAPNTAALAKAMAGTYNTVKHFDRGELPDHDEIYLIGLVNKWVSRLLALTLTGKGEELLKEHRAEGALWRIKEWFDGYGMSLDEDGNWVRAEPRGR